jgi:hypothetical protein
MLTKLALIILTVGAAQTTGGPTPAREWLEAEDPPIEGLWPSQNLIRLVVVRWCQDVSDNYDLDETQRSRYREAEVRRWIEFAGKHRSELQPLINEFIEMRMELEPPSKQRVQTWAERATPLFDELRGQVGEAVDEFKKVLTPLQAAKFETDRLKMSAGMMVAESKLKQWRSGVFELDEFWEPTRAEQRRRDAERRKRKAAEGSDEAEPKPATGEVDQIGQEVTAWEQYVEQCIRTYGLDEGQRDAARSCLSELKARALAHRDRRRDEIARLEEDIKKHTGSEAEMAQIKAQLTELYGPVDEMFQELRRRLEKIPTSAQREAIGTRGPNE